MRDPLSWSFRVFRLLGAPVKLHVTLVVFMIGLFLRQTNEPSGAERPFEILLLTFPVLFAVALWHEAGRVFAGRLLDVEVRELVLWPLGGLRPADAPREARPTILAALGGPAANAALCLAMAALLALGGFLPNMNPVTNPYAARMANFQDGRVYTSQFGLALYEPGTATAARPTDEMAAKILKPAELHDAVIRSGLDRAKAPDWAVWAYRVFWVSYVMLLLNLLPALPLDMGSVVQGALWWRSGVTQGTLTAAYLGYVVAAVLLIASLATNEVWVIMLALTVVVTGMARVAALDADEGGYGDFSGGYTSLDRDEPAPRAKRQPFMKRWLTARAAKRMHKENEERQREDERMDQLLDKIAQTGKQSLTDEERRFMERVSARYRNR